MRFIGIDALRAIAILVVLFHHIIWPQIKPLTTPCIFGNGGYMVVSLFFVLSGFVISLPYWQWKRNFDNFSKIFQFYKHRFFRLYPLFILSAFVSAVVIFGLNKESLKEIFLSLTTIWSFLPPYFFASLNPVYWSLMLEVLMSLIFPLIIIFSRRIHISIIVIFFIILAYFVQFFGWKIPFENPHTSPFRDYIFGHLDEFSFGIFLAWLVYFRNFFLPKKYIFLGIFILLIWIFLADSWRYGQFFGIIFTPDVIFISARNIFLMAAWMCIILGSFSFHKAPKWLTYIGAMCFSLYIWHMFFALFFEKFLGGVTGIFLTILYFIVVFLVSIFSFEIIEKKFWQFLVKHF